MRDASRENGKDDETQMASTATVESGSSDFLLPGSLFLTSALYMVLTLSPVVSLGSGEPCRSCWAQLGQHRSPALNKGGF